MTNIKTTIKTKRNLLSENLNQAANHCVKKYVEFNVKMSTKYLRHQCNTLEKKETRIDKRIEKLNSKKEKVQFKKDVRIAALDILEEKTVMEFMGFETV